MHKLVQRCVLGIAIATSAGCLVGTAPAPYQPGMEKLPAASVATREQVILNQLTTIKKAETFRYAERGEYASMDELVSGGQLNYQPRGLGYTIDLTVTDGGAGYEVIAVPVEYGPDGRRSFYMDQTGVIRGDDHEGGAPSADDPPVQ